jgi:hypothetical protein
MSGISRSALSLGAALFAIGLGGCSDETESPANTPAGTGSDSGVLPGAQTTPGNTSPGVSTPALSADAGTPVAVDGGSSVSAQPSANTGLPCAVGTLVNKYCGTCHGATPRFGTSAALATAADFQAAATTAAGKKRFEVALTRTHETNPALHMPPSNQPQPSAADLATLDAWFNAGAKASTETCASTQAPGSTGTTAPVTSTEGLECYKLLAHANGSKTEKFKVGVARDGYYNFSFKAPWEGDAYGVVLRPVIDNDKALHHWLLFQQSGVTDGQVSTSSGTHPTGELVHGWAPGGNELDFRTAGDVGFEFKAGTGFTVEFHYNSDDANALDASGVEVCVQKKKPANLAGISWLGSDAIIGTSAGSTCTPKQKTPIHILGVSPHMHLKGKHMSGIINRADGKKETLHDGDFSFNDQTWYKKDVVLNPGDTITTTCTFSTFATFGPGTSDEMCYLFTVAYPKGALSDGGSVGTATHGGGACLGL